MENSPQQFSLDEMAALVDLPRRTVRYYIQMGLVDRPDGAGRGAYYLGRHLEQLLQIKKWQAAGLSLDRIRELLQTDGEEPPVPPRKRNPGEVAVRSHIYLGKGVELSVDPGASGLTPESVKALATGAIELIERIKRTQEKSE